MPEIKTSNAPKNTSFAAVLMRLKLRRRCKEDYMEVGASSGVRDWITEYLTRLCAFLKVVTVYFKGVLA